MTETDVVERLRTFWREITESDDGESPQMVMTREAADEIERLRAELARLHRDECICIKCGQRQEGRTMSNSERLLPCPWCGGAGEYISTLGEWRSRAEGYGPDGIRVRCDNPRCAGLSPVFYGAAMKEEATSAWNRRSPSPDAEAARREAIEEAAKVALDVAISDIGPWRASAGAVAARIRALSPPVEGE